MLFTTYRRGKLESGDIDVLLTHPSYTSADGNAKKSQLLKEVVNSLLSKQLIIDTISLGDVKFMVSLFFQ
jgi:DNA polymerase beta